LKKLLVLYLYTMMNLLIEEERTPDESPEITAIIERIKFKLRRIHFPKACACIIILVLIYFLYYHTLQEHHMKKSTLNSFWDTIDLDAPCCERKYECWMQCLGKEIAFTPFNRLVIPGTHNSGVYTAAF